MSMGSAFHGIAEYERIAELERNLAIATSNCTEAVRQRDEARTLLGKSCRTLEAKLAIATQNCEQAVKERDEAKKALSAMHRRAQKAESIIEKSGIVDGRPKTAEGRSLGRALANYAASTYMRERDELRERLAAVNAELEDIKQELKWARKDVTTSDANAADVTMRAAEALKELKEWRAITVHGWCQVRLDKIIAALDWADDKSAKGEEGKP